HFLRQCSTTSAGYPTIMALSMLSRSTRSTRQSGLHLVLPMPTAIGDSATVKRAKSLRRKSILITQNNSATLGRSNRRIPPSRTPASRFPDGTECRHSSGLAANGFAPGEPLPRRVAAGDLLTNCKICEKVRLGSDWLTPGLRYPPFPLEESLECL